MQDQKGMTFFGMLITMAGIIILALLFMKAVPVFVHNYEVKSSIKSLQGLNFSDFSSDTTANIMVLKDKLMNQLYVNGFNDFKPEQITITTAEPGVYIVNVKYVVIKPLISNMSMMFNFDDTEEVTVGPK